MRFDSVPTTVAVASGKGGVGKTYVSVELAKTLAEAGASVGILDVDLTTPDSDQAAGVDTASGPATNRQSAQPGSRTVASGTGPSSSPVDIDGIQIVTKGTKLPDYAVNTNDERMQMETVMGFIRETEWDDETTHVIIDTPPGTGWEIQTVLRELRPDFGFVVTTGTVNAVRNACRTHELFRRVGLEHAVIANMRTSIPSIDFEGFRNRIEEIDAVDDSVRDEIIDVLTETVSNEIPLHDDGIDLADRFSVPVVADIPFTADTARVREELREAIEQVQLSSTIPRKGGR